MVDNDKCPSHADASEVEQLGPVTRPERRKRCSKCGKLRPISAFPKHSTSSDGYAAYCRECKNGLAKERRFKDPVARLKHYIVTRIKNEFPKEMVPDDIHTNLELYLGYKLFTLQKHLRIELKTREGITLFTCFKRGYHLDHRQPHSSFDQKRIGDDAFKACWAIDNLWMIDGTTNLQKGAKTGLLEQIDANSRISEQITEETEDSEGYDVDAAGFPLEDEGDGVDD